LWPEFPSEAFSDPIKFVGNFKLKMIVALIFSVTRAQEYSMRASSAGIVRHTYYLSANDFVSVIFEEQSGFIAIANNSKYFVNVGTGCNHLSSPSCVWNYSDLRAIISFGTNVGVAQIWVSQAGSMRITIGYTGLGTDARCYEVAMNIGGSVVGPKWLVDSHSASCFFQYDLSYSITSDYVSGFTVDLWTDYFDRTIQSGYVYSSSGITGVIVKNPSSSDKYLEFTFTLDSSADFEPAMIYIHRDRPVATAWASNYSGWYLDPGRAPGSPPLPTAPPTDLSGGPTRPDSSSPVGVIVGVVIAVIVVVSAGICLWRRKRKQAKEYSPEGTEPGPSEKDVIDAKPPPFPPQAAPPPFSPSPVYPGAAPPLYPPFGAVAPPPFAPQGVAVAFPGYAGVAPPPFAPQAAPPPFALQGAVAPPPFAPQAGLPPFPPQADGGFGLY
jgi:hypothetical protein